jgi:hypothetical protein
MYIELPASLRYIDNQAFFSCKELAMTPSAPFDIIVGGDIYYIGNQAFNLGASNIHGKVSNIIIGGSVHDIGD